MLPRQTPGFALVDAMVALAIFAVMTGLLFQTLASASSAARQISERRRAMLVGQSVLALAGGSGAARGAQRSGRDGDFKWRIETGPYQASALDNGRGLELVSVIVSRAGEDAAIVTLNTLRLAQ